MGGQLDGNFLAGSLPYKFIILTVTSFISLFVYFLLKYSLHGFPGLFTVISEHICFLLLVFLFLHF